MDVGEVPAEGYVTAVGWDNMLDVIKHKKKKRRASPELDEGRADRDGIDTMAMIRDLERKERRAKRKEREKRGGGGSEDEGEREKRRREGEAEEGGVFDGVKWMPKNALREWDLGKV